MSEQRVLLVQKSLIGTCAFLALVLLASFYMVVNGAVQRGAQQRLASVEVATQAVAPAAVQRAGAGGGALLARVGN